jgi:uncharacterized protein DUF6580
MSKPRFFVLVLMIVAAAASRLIPHPPNMASITAVALFGGACLSDKRLAFLVPMAALFLSDLVLGLYSHMEIVYGSFVLVVCVGLLLRKQRTPVRIAIATLTSSVLFFVITNFGVWAFESLYPKTLGGLATCYVAAIPFFQNTLAGDALYSALLFGGLALAERSFPILREPHVARLQSA